MKEVMRMLGFIAAPLGYVMYFCYRLLHNYAFAIVLFTLITKIILMPVSIWVHKNGIKIVKLTPELNRIKIRYFGDGDHIADETQKLYKQERYNPLASLIPLFLQIALLIGLIQVIYNPLTHLLHIDSTLAQTLTEQICLLTGANPESNSLQLQVVSAVQSGAYTAELLAVPGMGPEILAEISSLNLSAFGMNLGQTPAVNGGILIAIPLLAALASFILCVCQDKMNPLQAEQGRAGQMGTMLASVGISLFLGFFVPAGIGFYWIWSNLFTILQQLVLNTMISPKKYIDYEALEQSKQELNALESLGGKRKWYEHDPNAKREKADYKRFFSVANKHVVFYSEGSGFYKYFQNLIEYLLEYSNLTIHYITSDPNDQIFGIAEKQKRIRPYYIGEKKLITLMMKMDADIVLMTMPDIENYHIKRSYVKQDVEYIYMFHWCTSTHMVIREKALDHYDTIFCPGPHQVEEIRCTEKMYNLPEKKLVETSYGVIENLVQAYEKMEKKENIKPQILIAPSYQADNIMDSCIDELLAQLLPKGYKLIVRPHPQYIRRAPQKIEAFRQKYQKELEQGMFEFQTDFSSGNTVYQSNVVITDWSTISYEFSLTTMKPTLFINTPMKVVNPHYTEYPMEPLDITLRNQIGRSLELTETNQAGAVIEEMLANSNVYRERIAEIRHDLMPAFGKSAEIGGQYILDQLMKKQKKKNS